MFNDRHSGPIVIKIEFSRRISE